MVILHTADWHLGHRLADEDRTEEFSLLTDFIIETLRQIDAEALLIAGDVYDTATPSARTEKQFYDFLVRLPEETHCRTVVIVAGNHDSPQRLTVNDSLLKRLNIHIIGTFGRNFSNLLIPVFKSQLSGEECGIGAVPFLRNQDILDAVAGESFEDTESRFAEGLARVYRKITDEALKKGWVGRIPFLTTGHLFVADRNQPLNELVSESERSIHVGKLGAIAPSAFPEEIDYLALGHLHRPQKSSKYEHIRYSGSPLMLSFSERDQPKSLQLLEVKEGKLHIKERIPVPVWRKLIRLQASPEELEAKIASENPGTDLPSWVELIAECKEYDPDLNRRLRAFAEKREDIKIIGIRSIRTDRPSYERTSGSSFRAFTPEDVFDLLLEEKNLAETAKEPLRQTFRELLQDTLTDPSI